MRRQPGRSGALPGSLLRHADRQTVAGLAAVLWAMEARGVEAGRCSEWGVVAAPRFLGRSELAEAFDQYAVEGAWGVSPHLVPHHALHSMAGTISQALKIQGPNLGAGGGRDGEREGFLAAMSMLAGGRLAGVWLVLSGWAPELVPPGTLAGAPGTIDLASVCVSLALGLTGPHTESRGPGLRLMAGRAGNGPPSPFDATSLHEWLNLSTGGGPAGRRASWSLGEGVWIELELTPQPARQTT